MSCRKYGGGREIVAFGPVSFDVFPESLMMFLSEHLFSYRRVMCFWFRSGLQRVGYFTALVVRFYCCYFSSGLLDMYSLCSYFYVRIIGMGKSEVALCMADLMMSCSLMVF